MSKRINKYIFLVWILLIILPSISKAHGMTLTLVEPGLLKAEYDGGGFSPRMEVQVFDKDGNLLTSGPVDHKGEFHFDKSLDVHRATVDDGMGHMATYEKGVEEVKIPKMPVVIAVFILIGIIFKVYYGKK